MPTGAAGLQKRRAVRPLIERLCRAVGGVSWGGEGSALPFPQWRVRARLTFGYLIGCVFSKYRINQLRRFAFLLQHQVFLYERVQNGRHQPY